MSGITGQAVGLAVGAAVGSVVPVVGTAAGAAVGSAVGGFVSSSISSNNQGKMDAAALELQLSQAKHTAAEKSAIHSTNFRQALASQVALTSMRGGSSTVMAQFTQESYRNFLQDEQALKMGLSVAEAGAGIERANLAARSELRTQKAFGSAVSSATTGLNLNVFG